MMLFSGLFVAASDFDYQPPFVTGNMPWQEVVKDIRKALTAGVKQHFITLQPSVLLLDRKWYKENLAEPLGKWALLWFEKDKNGEIKLPGGVVPVFESESVREHVLSYLVGQTPTLDSSNPVFADADLKKLLGFARKWLTALIPHCLSKRHGIDYGLLQGKHLKSWKERSIRASLNENRLMLAVPFQGLETPSAFSEFASPDVSIGLTVLAYHNEGMRREDVEVLVANMRDRMMNVDNGPYRVRPTRATFERMKSEARLWCRAVLDVDQVGE